MKKSVILASTLLVSTAFGELSDEQILSMFDLPKGVEAKIDERSQLEVVGLEQIIIAIKSKTDAEKIALLRKYYDKANAAPEYKAEKIKKEQEIVHSIFATGAIRGVPAFIEASNLEIK